MKICITNLVVSFDYRFMICSAVAPLEKVCTLVGPVGVSEEGVDGLIFPSIEDGIDGCMYALLSSSSSAAKELKASTQMNMCTLIFVSVNSGLTKVGGFYCLNRAEYRVLRYAVKFAVVMSRS